MGFKTLQNFEEIYITADLHLSNIVNRTIAYRGFNNAEEHTKHIRNMINSTIKNKNAILYILGDIGFKEQDDELIHFIKSLTPQVKVCIGNHDSARQLKRLWSMGIIQDCKQDYKIRWRKNLFHMQHLPLMEWEGFYYNGYCLFGHTHGNLKPYYRAMDVGLDANNMQILNLEDVVKLRKEYSNIDNNGKRLEFNNV